ncbi:molybdopterin-guanine dinucleotide biosynthesis protein B [Sulfurimonas sp. MAG313]|nr:molybdopterin-guanine dinucleotide biosynthesis protein B [Sulfurimonas sp. MAG313]MDF1881399.1 molybdopterin-guanine dinucleotide biosynthesis protein B [Sulfurimonas sp. MAG313]
MKKRLAVAFTGPSNSGKTTLIVKVAQLLIQNGHEVAIIKNDPKDKGTFDASGKDSHKFSQTGAEVVVTSPKRTTYFSKRHQELEQIINMFNDFDFLLVEGLKNLPLPRISVFRNTIDEDYYPYMNALAIDESINAHDENIPNDIQILDLNNTSQIIDWIKNNAKEV